MVRLKDLSYQYKDNTAPTIENISFFIRKGEVVVLAGQSGCGKSTIFRCINGLCPRFFEGEKKGGIYLNGKESTPLRICDISRLVASVFQNPESQFFTTDVLSDLVYACENYGVSKGEIETRLNRIVSMLSLSPLIGKKLSELSGGEKQKVAIASTLMLNADVLLLDEPSSNLDYQSIALLKAILAELKSKGYTIIVIEHRLYYLADVCDRLIVFERGKISRIYEGVILKAVSNEELHLQGLRGLHPFQNTVCDLAPKRGSGPLFILDNLIFGYEKFTNILKGVSFSVYPGDKIALIGRNGCGKTTLGKILCGLIKEQQGCVRFMESPLFSRDRNRVASYVMQNVDFQLFGCNVYDDLLLGNKRSPNVENRIHSILSLLGLSALESQHPTTLSMGQKQRLVIAASYLLNKRINVFDEPTSGLDYGSMKNVCDLIDSITGNENASIVITHDYEFILSVCNRVILLENGKITRDFPLKDTTVLENIFKEKL